MGLTFLSKETSIVLLAAVYAFLALTPELRVRLRDLAVALGVMALVIAPFPLSLMLAGRTGTGESYLTWQLFRRPNHDWLFYPQTVPEVDRPARAARRRHGALAAAPRGVLAGDAAPVLDRGAAWPSSSCGRSRASSTCCRSRPPLAVLAGRALSGRWVVAPALWACSPPRSSAASLLIPTWDRIEGSATGRAAGRGGRAAGRARGGRVDRRRTSPRERRFMTIGPSMANLVQYYGHRKAYGLSVSPNPLNRNPSYEPLVNPDQALRDNEIQYVVWDAFSASRSPSFSSRLLALRRPLQRPGRPQRGAPGRAARGLAARQAGDRRLRGAPVIGPRRPRAGPRRRVSPAAAAAAAPTTPIEHFVVLMQENHSFDNYFGTFPGADGIPAGTCMPVGRARTAVRAAVPPRRSLGSTSPRPRIHRMQYAAGTDGRLRPGGVASTARRWTRSVMGYYDGRDLPFYWNVADEYVLFDRFFAASPSGSVANHRFWVSGTARAGAPTIFDRLDSGDLLEVLRPGLRPAAGVRQCAGGAGPRRAIRGCCGTSWTSTSTTRT